MPGIELFGDEERKEVNDVLETGILFRYNHDEPRKGIWKAKTLESQIKDFTGAGYAHFVSSGTAAVQAALAAVGIGYGDEVIVPPYTFIATIEAVIFAGAIPVFAEVDETLCLNPESIRKNITSKTKAIVLVHMCGAIGHIDEIMQICKEHKLVFVEDSAQALGATYKGKHAGTFGKVGCYSFDFFKVTTSGEGGIIVTNDEQIYKNVDTYSDHGHDHHGNARGMENHPNLGVNFRAGELNAAIGVAQMRKLPYILERQRENYKPLKAVFEKFPQITFRHIPEPEGDSFTFLSFFGPTEAKTREILKALGEEGVDGLNYWFDNMYHFHKQWTHIKEKQTLSKQVWHVLEGPQDLKTLKLPKSDEVIGRLISMGVRVTWTPEQIKDRCDRIEKALTKVFV